MPRRTRREFLQHVAALPLASCATVQGGAPPSAPLPPHRPIDVPGLHAYADHSVAAGETIRFRASSTVPYTLSICRLGPDDDEVLHTFPPSAAAPRPIHPGSYVHVERNLTDFKALTLECRVRPWRLNAWQGLVTQHDYPDACGIGLFIDASGSVLFYMGDGGAYRPERVHPGPKLVHRRWHHLVGTWDGKTQALWIDGERCWSRPLEGPVRPGSAPLRLSAYANRGLADAFLDGDLAQAAVYDRALTEAEIRAPRREGALASWPLDEGRGDRVAGGRIINTATWIPGALRFASDDLTDCRWEVTHEWRVPPAARPGFYVGQYRGEKHGTDVTFIVRRPDDRPRAPILVLAATNTWRAYGATPFAPNTAGPTFWGTEGLAGAPAGSPMYCCYRDHAAGQPTYMLGARIPWRSAAPDVLYSPQAIGYSHLMRAERYLLAWLEKNGYAYDLITDHDFHQRPDAPAGYRALLINGHSEYWSIPMYEGLERYLRGGGNLAVLSGNTMFWRVSFEEDGTMECRKFGPSIGGRPGATVEELVHSHDGKRGSLMREAGFPAWRLLGLESIGWAGTGRAEDYGRYMADRPDHFLFTTPEKTGLERGGTFGEATGGGLPRAVGHEWDVRLATLKKMSPAPVPDEPAGITTLARGIMKGARTFDYAVADAPAVDGTVAEMIYWERPEGGRVFHAGAIGAGWALSADPRLQALMRNVLHHFGVSKEA